MLRNILSPETCAKCRMCCIFDKYDVWETPVVSAELYEKIHAARPELKFVSKGDSGAYIFNMEETWDSERELFICPALDPDKGCTLGDNKPFDCKIWPYPWLPYAPICMQSPSTSWSRSLKTALPTRYLPRQTKILP